MRPERLTWALLRDADTILRVLTRLDGSPARTIPGAFDACAPRSRCGFRHRYSGTSRHYCTMPRKYDCIHRCFDAWPGPPVRMSGVRGDSPLSDDERTRECHRAILHASVDIALTGKGMAAKAAQVMWHGDEWGAIENEHRMAAQIALASEIARRITRERQLAAEARKRARKLRGSK